LGRSLIERALTKPEQQMYYPIIVVQGDLFDGRPSKTGVRLNDADHILFMQNAIVNGNERAYLIDIIKESYFEKFLDLVEDEVAKIVRRIQRRKSQVKNSIDEIALGGKKAGNDEEIMEIMEF
jgi:hypothetical protein